LILAWRTVYSDLSFCVFFTSDPTRLKQFQTFSTFKIKKKINKVEF